MIRKNGDTPDGKSGKRWVAALLVAGLFSTLPACQTSPAEPFTPKSVNLKESSDTPRSLSISLSKSIDTVLDGSLSKGQIPETVMVPKIVTNRGVSLVLGRYLASRIGERLSQDPSLKVVDAGKLRQEMHLEGIVQGGQGSVSMVNIAKKLGADRLVLGVMTDLGQEIEVSVRILSVSSGEVLGQVNQVVQKNGAFLNLWDVGP